MHEGIAKAYYAGLALGARRLLVAAYIPSLTAPDEAPQPTNQLMFDLDQGWSSIWYPNDFITDFAVAQAGPLALSRSGRVFDTSDAREVLAVDLTTKSHMHGIAANRDRLLVCGDDGRLYAGTQDGMALLPGPHYTRAPGPDAGIREKLAWSKARNRLLAVDSAGSGVSYAAGLDGMILQIDGTSVQRLQAPTGSNLSDISVDHGHGGFLACAHSPIPRILQGDVWGGVKTLYESADVHYFVSVASLEGMVYVADIAAATSGVYRLESGTLGLAEFSDRSVYGPARSLNVSEGVLWAVFERAVVRYDGQDWEVIAHPAEL